MVGEGWQRYFIGCPRVVCSYRVAKSRFVVAKSRLGGHLLFRVARGRYGLVRGRYRPVKCRYRVTKGRF